MSADAKRPHIVLCCATNRGLRFLRLLARLASGCDLTVVSFPEQTWEPPFLAAIRAEARQAGATFFESGRMNEYALLQHLRDRPVDLLFAVSWRYLIDEEIFSRSRIGSFVLHDSLLPRNRGFSPTVWAVLRGEECTGATLFEMSGEVDAGDIIDQERVPIDSDEAIGTVMERVTGSYLRLLERNFDALLSGTFRKVPQDENLASYNPRLSPADFDIDWRQTASRVLNIVRAYSRPYPGAYSWFDGEVLRIWQAELADVDEFSRVASPGCVLEANEQGIVVATADRPLRLTQFALEGSQNKGSGAVIPGVSVLGWDR